jgi:chromosome segregation ATPase
MMGSRGLPADAPPAVQAVALLLELRDLLGSDGVAELQKYLGELRAQAEKDADFREELRKAGAAHDQRHAELEAIDSALVERATNLDARQAEVDKQAASLQKKETAVSARDGALRDRETVLKQNLDTLERQQNTHKEQVADFLGGLDAKRAEFNASLAKQNIKHAAELHALRAEAETEINDLKLRAQADLDARWAEVNQERARLEQLETARRERSAALRSVLEEA